MKTAGRALFLAGTLAAALDARAQEASPAASPSAPTQTAGPQAVVETAQGQFVVRLLPELAPRHVQHFVTTAKAGGFEGTTFHRIIPMGIIQGGDPLTKDPGKTALYGTGGLGLLKAEFSDRPMKRGVVAAVLRPRQPNSAGNQFFVCITDQLALTGQ